mgnify:FL=1
MISWIRGEIIDSWLQNKKLYVLINCNGIGYEIQVLESLKKVLNNEIITLWIQQIKREDSDTFFGFKLREERDFFRDLLKIKGIGPQIGMSLLNKHDLFEIINSVKNKDEKLFSSVPGIGQKMVARIFLELKNKNLISSDIKNHFNNENNITSLNNELKIMIEDIDTALKSLNYSPKERIETINFISNKLNNDKKSIDLTFESLFKDALDYLEIK